MKRDAITYRRVSTDRQAKEGQSLAAQQEAVERLCKVRDWRVSACCQDQGKSGRTREGRPGLDDAIRLACERKGVLVAYSLSRLCRSVIDASEVLGELRAAGADLVVVDCAMDTTTASGELVFNIFSAIAQFESQMIGERIRVVNQRTVDNCGYRTQGVQPAGWKIENGRQVRVESEWKVLDRIQQLTRVLKKPGKIAREMTLAGEPTITQLRGGQDKTGWNSRKVRALQESLEEQRAAGMI